MDARTSIVLQNRNLSRRTGRPCWRARRTATRVLALLFGLLIGPVASVFAASTAGAAAPEPAGAYLLNQASLGPTGALNAYMAGIDAETESGKDLFVGYVLRVEMPDLIVNDNDTSGAIQWDFSPIISSLEAIQQESLGVRASGYRDLVTLQVLVFPQLLTGGDQPPPILLAQIPSNEQYTTDSGVVLPVPWSQAAVGVLEGFYSALANTPITDYSQPGNPTLVLKDHPTLANINVAPIGHKGYRDNNATPKIKNIVSSTGGVTYDRDAYVAGLLGSINAAASAFPNDFAFVEFFGFKDSADAQYGGETLDQRVDRDLDMRYNGLGQSSFGVWRENLGDYGPALPGGQNLLDYEAAGFISDPEGTVLFQSIRNWLGQQPSFGENAVDGGAVVNAMLFAYATYGARYLEVYPQDVTITTADVALAFADIPHDPDQTDAQIQVILQDLLVAWNSYLVNGPGVVADSATVNQGSGANTIQVMANDAQPPGPGPWDNPNTLFPADTNLLKLNVTAVTQGANGAVTIGANGIDVTYTPDSGFSGTDSFTYTVGDQYLLEATTTVTVTVTGCVICDCNADPSGCDGFQDVTDVVQTINVAFRGAGPIPDPDANCPYETTDVDCTNSTDIVDVVKMINVAFRGADQTTEFCNPCL